jgi:hypothetical protein
MFFQNVWVHFGLPKSIISDRDSRFVGSFWSSLWALMDTKLKKSIAFHPQTDGQTEVVNRTVVHLLRAYCSKHPKLWDEHLHYIQHAYNRAKHSSTQTSPFEACFVYLPKSPLDFIFGKDIAVDGQYDIDRAETFIEQIQSIHQMVQEQLEKSQAKYKTRHDKHRVDHSFQVGDEVWLYISKERLKGEGKIVFWRSKSFPMGRCDPGDQILLKNSKCLESLQIERERRPRRYEPNATRLGSNGRREREISRSVQNDKQAKKGVLTVQSVRTLTWQAVRHVAGSYLDSWHVTWHVCSERDDDTWPSQWPPRVIYLLV